MKAILLVFAVTLLVSPAVVSPRHIHRSDDTQLNLNTIYDLAEKCIASLKEEAFVEDVSHLAEGWNKCGDKFFCKVYNILHDNHRDFCGKEDKEMLVRNLRMYNSGRNVQCEKPVKGTTSASVEVLLSRLLEHVKRCVQHRNFTGTKK